MKWKIKQLNDSAITKKLLKQFVNAKENRTKYYEAQWGINEATAFSAYWDQGGEGEAQAQPIDIYNAVAASANDGPDSSMGICYSFKYLRYLHAQASANPPACIPTPRTADYGDRRAASVADAFIHYGRKQLNVQEVQDLRSLGCLLHGSGFSKLWYNPAIGEIKVDEEEGTVETKGEIDSHVRWVWDVWLDPDAREWKKVKYLYDRYLIPIDEACSRWPNQEKFLESKKGKFQSNSGTRTQGDKHEEEMVEVYEYWEAGAPWNGYLGRHAWLHMENDKACVVLGEIEENEHPEQKLPYQIHTDIDVPGQVYGKAFLDYIARLQDLLNRLDSFTLEQIQAHGNVRLVIYDDMEVGEQTTNNSWDVIQVKGNGGTPPLYINPPQLMPDMFRFRQQLIEGMEALSGMNESMFGQIKRELSGYATQSAINSANLTRRRFFVKFKYCTEEFYRSYLELIQMHYKQAVQLKIVGKEDGVSIAFYKGSDLKGNYDFDTDYGTSFSLDPESRREEVLSLQPLLEKAQYSAGQILGFLRFSDAKGPIDLASRAKMRQYEIFDEMEATFMEKGVSKLIEPKKNEDHVPMLEACKEYRSSAQFKYLPDELQNLMDAHIDARTEQAAAVAAGAQAGGAPVAGGDMPAGLPGSGSPDQAAAAAATGLAQGAPGAATSEVV